MFKIIHVKNGTFKGGMLLQNDTETSKILEDVLQSQYWLTNSKISLNITSEFKKCSVKILSQYKFLKIVFAFKTALDYYF